MEQWQLRKPCPVQLPVGFRSIRPDALTELNRQSELRGRCLRFQQAEFEIHGKPARDARAADEYERTTYAGDGDAAYLAHRFMPRPTATGKASGEQAQYSTDSRAVRFASRYKLVFSLLNEDVGTGGVKDWEVTPALEKHVLPLLQSLRDLHSFDVETQVQYYSPLLVERTPADGQSGSVIEEDQLKAFVNSADWNLASAVSTDPVLHFILYLPARQTSPLLVRRTGTGTISPLTGFLTPQWGSIAILDSSAFTPSGVLSSSQLAGPFDGFVSHLRTLLGLPAVPSLTPHPRGQQGLPSEVEALMRERTVQNAREAVDRLGAIAKQVQGIQNMRIPRAVQADVRGVLDALTKIEAANLTASMAHSAQAVNLASRASFNHEMLALLYFPDEHKWAVYMPLFGPMLVPLLVALVREVKEYRNRKKLATAEPKAE